MLIIWKFLKSIAGRTKRLRRRHAAREPRVIYVENSMSEKEALLPTKRIFCNQYFL